MRPISSIIFDIGGIPLNLSLKRTQHTSNIEGVKEQLEFE